MQLPSLPVRGPGSSNCPSCMVRGLEGGWAAREAVAQVLSLLVSTQTFRSWLCPRPLLPLPGGAPMGVGCGE